MADRPQNPGLKEGSARQWRGLVVDDAPAVCHATGMALSSLGGQITTAENGAQALEIVQLSQKLGFAFDLVLTDVQMPVMNGIDATRRMRNEGFTGPIIAVTGSLDPDVADRCLAAGCDEYVRKPASYEKLAMIVARFCRVYEISLSQRKCMSTAASLAAAQV